MRKKRPTFRVQVAIRSVAEFEFDADTLEQALTQVTGEAALNKFLKENPTLAEGWEEIDGNQRCIGVYEMEPGWSFLEK